MSKRSNSRKASERRSVTRSQIQPSTLYRRVLRYEPLEDRRMLAVVTVTTLADTTDPSDGLISLNESIVATNVTPGADTIDFAPSLTANGPATIVLSRALPIITDALTVSGPGAAALTLKPSNGGGLFRISDRSNANLFDASLSGLSLTGATTGAINTSENLTLTNCVISGNRSLSPGGAIYSGSGNVLPNSLTIVGCTISNNSSNSEGGAIRKTYGSLTITNSTLDGNTAGSAGGAISAADGGIVVTIENSTISNNKSSQYYGGGVFVKNGNTTVNASTISGNSAPAGGGIYCQFFNSSYSLRMTSTVVSNNYASSRGGGVECYGAAVITQCTISDNSTKLTTQQLLGGSIGGIEATTLTLVDSTVSGNKATTIGGISCRSAEIVNSTLSGNTTTGTTSSAGSAALYSRGGLVNIRYSTIIANSSSAASAGAIVAKAVTGTVLTIRSSIVAGNVNGDVAFTGSTNPIVSLGYNLIGTGNAVASFNQPGDQTGVLNPMLGPLADNGGPTLTHALLAGSPAINNGDLSSVAGVNGVPLYDQRGTPFGRVFNGRIDIGAFEYQQTSDLNLVVDTLVDESNGNYGHGDLSLREAITLANLYSSTDTIRFDPALTASGPATILLTLGDLKISSSMTITGPVSNLLTIDASGNDPTPAVKDGQGIRIFNVDNGTSVVIDVGISGLTLKGGDVAGDGGAISSSENLTIAGSTFSGSSASGSGGGVFSQTGALVVSGSTFSGNTSRGRLVAAGGGGAVASLGNTTIDQSTFSGNSASLGGAIRALGDLLVDHSTITGNFASNGGGITSYNTVGTPNSLTIRDSSIVNNVASGEGGGVRQRFGSLLIERTTITGNNATWGGGIDAADGNVHVQIVDSEIAANVLNGFGGTGYGGGMFLKIAIASVVRSRISGNSGGMLGGGIYALGGALTIERTTVSGNFAGRGGGIASSSGLTYQTIIRNSTISGNTATIAGGGINSEFAVVSIENGTITNNSAPAGKGGGVFARGPGLGVRTAIVRSSIIAGNLNGDVDYSASIAFASLGYNVIGTGNAVAQFNQPSDLTGVQNPMLSPLADNGGPTMTHGLLSGSPAINAGDPAAMPSANGVPVNDQRGVPFIRIYGGRIDVGAFELQPTAFVLGDFNRDGFVDSSDYTIFRKQLNQTVVPGTGADANGDGIVNNADYLVWKSNYGVLPTQLPQSVAVAPVAGLSEGATFSAAGQPATLSQVSSSDNFSPPRVAPQFVLSLSASRTPLRSTHHALPSPGASSDLAARMTRFDYAIDSWFRSMVGTNKRRFLESDEGQFRFADCTQNGQESPASAGLVVDEAFASL